MYLEAYELIREILADEELNEFVLKTTGKHLAIIDAGAVVSTPAAGILFAGGEVGCPQNNMQRVEYNVPFALPYWGSDAMRLCHEFIDIAVKAFFAYYGDDKRVRMVTVNPSIVENDPENKWWTVNFTVSISIFRT